MQWAKIPTLGELESACHRARVGYRAPAKRRPLLLIEAADGSPRMIGVTNLVYVDIQTGEIAGYESEDFDSDPRFDPERHFAALLMNPAEDSLAVDVARLAALADRPSTRRRKRNGSSKTLCCRHQKTLKVEE